MEAEEVPEDVPAQEATPVTPEEKVFENELLLDKILKFSIYDKGNASLETANRCKLVQRLWLDRVAIALEKIERPLVRFNTNSLEGHVKIAKFIDTFGESPPNRIPRFDFRFESAKEDWWDCSPFNLCCLIKLLQKCGTGLVRMTIKCFHGMCVPGEKYGGVQVHSGRAVLPQLDSLTVLEDREMTYDLCRGVRVDGRTMLLVNWILSGAENLQYFSLDQSFIKSDCEPHLEIDGKKLKVPATVTEASIVSWCDQHYMNALFEDNFANITKLRVETCNLDCNNVILNIAKRFHQQLQIFDIKCAHLKSCGTLPVVMEKLESVSCPVWKPEWDGGLQTYFPALKQIDFFRITYDMLRMLLEATKCLTADVVVVELEEASLDAGSQEEAQLAQIVRLNTALPNVTHLIVVVPTSEEFYSLKYIFREMTQLRILQIRINYHSWGDEDEDAVTVNVDHVNARLLGISPMEVAALSQNPENWESVTVIPKGPALVNMQELKRLEVRVYNPFGQYDMEGNLDVAVQFGCLKMEKLQNLWLDKFKVSSDIAEKWTDEGRILYQV